MRDIRIGKVSLIGLYALLVSVCYIMPVIKYSIPYMPLALFLILSYCLTIHEGKIDGKLVLPVIFCSGGLAIMSLLVMRRGDITEAINEFVRALRFVAPAFLYLMLVSRVKQNKKMMKIIFGALSVLLFWICRNTVIALNDNSMIARILASGSLSSEMAAYRFQNVGGFEFCYAIGFVALYFLSLLLQNKRRFIKILLCGIYIYLLYFIIRTQYMTLLLLITIFSIIIIYLNSSRGINKWIIACLIILLLISLPTILSYLGTLTGNEESILTEKFQQMSMLFSGADISVVGSRPELYSDAFEIFFDSPIWGNVTMLNGVAIDNMDKCHSTLLGYLQGMGIIGAFLFYYPIFKLSKAIDCTFSVRLNHYIWKNLIFMFVLLSVFNPIQYCFEICFILFLYIPCGMQAFSEHTACCTSNNGNEKFALKQRAIGRKNYEKMVK